MSAGFQFQRLDATERIAVRREVTTFAEELYVDQRQTWWDLKRANKPCKPRWATRDECFQKSRQIRTKRERDANYWNDTTSPHPQY